MKLVNLTPHEVNVHTPQGVITVPASGQVARVSAKTQQVGQISVGESTIPVFSTVYGEVEGLPSPTEGVFYIVSLVTRLACEGREDVFSPGDVIRNESGAIVGCHGLSQ